MFCLCWTRKPTRKRYPKTDTKRRTQVFVAAVFVAVFRCRRLAARAPRVRRPGRASAGSATERRSMARRTLKSERRTGERGGNATQAFEHRVGCAVAVCFWSTGGPAEKGRMCSKRCSGNPGKVGNCIQSIAFGGQTADLAKSGWSGSWRPLYKTQNAKSGPLEWIR